MPAEDRLQISLVVLSELTEVYSPSKSIGFLS